MTAAASGPSARRPYRIVDAARARRRAVGTMRRGLRDAVNDGWAAPRDLAKLTWECFAPLGGVELELPARVAMREPPDFSAAALHQFQG